MEWVDISSKDHLDTSMALYSLQVAQRTSSIFLHVKMAFTSTEGSQQLHLRGVTSSYSKILKNKQYFLSRIHLNNAAQDDQR